MIGNITHIQEYAGNTSATYNAYYQYDSQNQLVREDHEKQGITYTYTYDRGGNLLQKKCYSYTTGNLPSTPNQQYEYTYGGATATWQDQLTGYNGETITYDGVGNPLTYRDGMEFTWQAGRKLAGMVKDGVSATYKYNSDGIRTEKVVNGVKTVYYIVDNAVVAESRSNGVNILYLFDESGTRIGMTYNGQNYYYLFNAQGDVTALMNSSGAVEYRYVYDAWGKLIGIYNGSGQDVTDDTALANVGYHNPIRYRGYYYDNETGLYYVSSRYYDPEVGRWINADNQIATGDMSSMNLFAYCGNNPVNRIDPTGEAWWHWALGAAVVAACAVATVVTCGGFAAAATAVCMVSSGVAAATTVSTVAAAAFVGSATVFGTAVLSAASSSDSVEEFNAQGNWEIVVTTAFGGLSNACDGYTMSKTQTPTSTPTGKGTQNPKVKAAVQKGQAMHKQMDYGPGVVKEKTIAPGCRVDGIDIDNRIIYELKPNNPQAIARGMKQLDRYTSAASEQFGGKWTGVLKLYD